MTFCEPLCSLWRMSRVEAATVLIVRFWSFGMLLRVWRLSYPGVSKEHRNNLSPQHGTTFQEIKILQSNATFELHLYVNTTFIAYLSLHILSGSSVVWQLKVKLEVNKICWTCITPSTVFWKKISQRHPVISISVFIYLVVCKQGLDHCHPLRD
jgi:hypothetical protein